MLWRSCLIPSLLLLLFLATERGRTLYAMCYTQFCPSNYAPNPQATKQSISKASPTKLSHLAGTARLTQKRHQKQLFPALCDHAPHGQVQGREGTRPSVSLAQYTQGVMMGLLEAWNQCSVSMQGDTGNNSKKEWSICIGHSIIKPIEVKC